MSGTRRTALALLVTLAVVVSGDVSAVGAQEDAQVSVGWWTRSPAQSAPEGGFAVASAPDGPVTVAAVVFDVGGDIAAGTLTALETDGVGQAGATVVVCPTSGPVRVPAEAGGALGDAPEPDCERGSVPFERDADSGRWNADVSALVVGLGGDVSLMLVPGPSEGPLPATFDVRFAAPEARLRLVPAETGTDSRPDQGSGTEAPPAPAPAEQPGTFESAPPRPDPTPAPAAPFLEPVEQPDAPAAPTETPPTDDGTVVEDAAPRLVPAVGSSPGSGPEVGKALTYVLLSALAGALVAGVSRAARARQLAR